MAIKCIAIGNRILKDDGIGIRIAEELVLRLEKENIEVIFGETDQAYALSMIEPGDFLFILDATYFNITPGTITITPIVDSNDYHHSTYTQHQPSLFSLIPMHQKIVKGYLIGTEIDTIDFGVELSDTLREKLQSISNEVFESIKQLLRETQL